MNKKQREAQFKLGHISIPFQHQFEMIIELGNETELLLDSSFLNEAIEDSNLNKSFRNIWFWVLGAYEFTRTINEKENIVFFSLDSKKKLKRLKLILAQIRIPFAKQENVTEGDITKMPKIYIETLISGFDKNNKDFIYFIKDKKIKFRELFKQFNETIIEVSTELPNPM